MANNRKRKVHGEERRKPSRPKQGARSGKRRGGSEGQNPRREERNPGSTPADRGDGSARHQDETFEEKDE